MKTEEKLEFYGGSKMALVPFLIFVIITIGLSFANAADLNMMIASGVIGLILGMVLAKNKGKFWDTVLVGMGQKLGMTAVLIWLLVGIYGSLLKTGHLVEGIVWLSDLLHLSGAAFTVAAFVFSATFALATGAAFGTIATMGFIIYPVGILMGSSPAMLGGAILSGAIFGDNIAPVSDTTIVSSTGQLYTKKEGHAEIGGSVRDRSKYVLVSFLIAAVLFFIFGGAKTGEGLDASIAEGVLSQYKMPAGLFMVIPTALVIFLAVKGLSLFATLSVGIVAVIITGLTAGLFSPSDLINITNGTVAGAIPSGVTGMYSICILLIVVVSMSNILMASGFMEEMVNSLSKNIKTTRGAEITIFLFSTILSILISAINTIANICAAPLVNAIGQKYQIHPYRRANFLAVAVCSFNVFVPFGGGVLFLLGIQNTLSSTYPFVEVLSPNAFMLTTFYPLVLWIVMFVAVLTGWGRIYEGPNGSISKTPVS